MACAATSCALNSSSVADTVVALLPMPKVLTLAPNLDYGRLDPPWTPLYTYVWCMYQLSFFKAFLYTIHVYTCIVYIYIHTYIYIYIYTYYLIVTGQNKLFFKCYIYKRLDPKCSTYKNERLKINHKSFKGPAYIWGFPLNGMFLLVLVSVFSHGPSNHS